MASALTLGLAEWVCFRDSRTRHGPVNNRFNRLTAIDAIDLVILTARTQQSIWAHGGHNYTTIPLNREAEGVSGARWVRKCSLLDGRWHMRRLPLKNLFRLKKTADSPRTSPCDSLPHSKPRTINSMTD